MLEGYFNNRSGGVSNHAPHQVIREVYPVNLLPNEVLTMPWGKTARTLGEALKEHPGTARFERYNDHCWRWEPHWEAIETLRVDLFRAGRLWYQKMDAWQQPDWHRPDWSAPYEYTGELPDFVKPGWSDFWAHGYTP
ncbi:hypothetical protein [Phycisphaera mikurensis]|uniref:Uncharacterized protein n=1 Tax=Phycisphaera mikurensis (strain NBRC 102666 / KCTC 22515 / FYK2301M01) TaxID=1142394 RepID=I0IBP4_PHYMF|nr:hypothetical protein [Phycisphaera mikurensis]MBB6443378.1 hypothetical protein [Phycisphaera mikurensis]BAM02682.1 hypothetical protein PSMK_05230 [Phycisphaera mikurensis NBRC 102666]